MTDGWRHEHRQPEQVAGRAVPIERSTCASASPEQANGKLPAAASSAQRAVSGAAERRTEPSAANTGLAP